MNIHTATTEVPGNIKPMVANAVAFGDAIKGPRKRQVVREWMSRERKSQKAESDLESTYIQCKGTEKERMRQAENTRDHTLKHPQKQE